MEILMKRAFLTFCICLVAFFNGCSYISTPIERTDIYAKCAKGDTLSFELFKRVQRIIKTDKWYFIWLDLYEEHEGLIYAEHLLVCDHNFILKGASGIYPEIINARGDTLFGITSEEYINEKNRNVKPYRDDLPKEIVFTLIKREKLWNGYQRGKCAIVDSIQFVQNTGRAKFYIKTADSINLASRKQYFEDVAYYSKAFSHTKESEYPISLLHFDRGRQYIYTIENNDIQFEMLTLEESVIEKFLIDIWNGVRK